MSKEDETNNIIKKVVEATEGMEYEEAIFLLAAISACILMSCNPLASNETIAKMSSRFANHFMLIAFASRSADAGAK